MKNDVQEIAKLDQKEYLRGKRSFTLRDDGTVLAEYRSIGAGRSQTVQTAVLDPNPRREQHREIGLLIVCLLLISGLAVTAFGAVASRNEETRVACLVAGIPLLILALVSGVAYRRRSFDLVIFDSLYLDTGLLMYHDNPTKLEFESFIGLLQKQIREHRSKTPQDGGMADQLRALAQLRDDGILTDEEFAKAKENLIGGNDPRGVIGFQR